MEKCWRVLAADGEVVGILDSKPVAENVSKRNEGSRVQFGFMNVLGEAPTECREWIEALMSSTMEEIADVMAQPEHLESMRGAINHDGAVLGCLQDLVDACDDLLEGDPVLVAARVALGYDEPDEEEEDSLRAALFNE